MNPRKVIIIGASFGGRHLAEAILTQNNSDIQITFVDKSDHMQFICTFYKVLSGSEPFDQYAVSND